MAVFACSAGNDSSSTDGFSDTTTAAGQPQAGSGAQMTAGTGGAAFVGSAGVGGVAPSTSTGPDTDCAEETKLVYVVSQERGFYSFDPSTLTFTQVGVLHCPDPGAQPFSMAVDRNGVAWVLYSDSEIFAVDIKTAACTATSFHSQGPFSSFGMGFTTNGATSTQETLYLANYTGAGLGKLDTTNMVVSAVGPYDQVHASAELTGTGDGRLFAFFETTPIQIGEIDPTNAHVLSLAPQPGVMIGSAWAFAFWGGSFWLFTNPSGGGSRVTNYDPTTMTTQVVLPNVGGFSIVGAGVSTCAPVVPPH
ncbi:MAG TPA: hypothetical protein VGM56_26685 [Byssovorax sp.]|jgi:streptogramin lyase